MRSNHPSLSTPPSSMIDFAIEAARQSPCAKSKRGAVLFDDACHVWGKGWNGPPLQIKGSLGNCDGSETCRRHCSQRCLHAESRAIIEACNWSLLDGETGGGEFPAMLYVKIDENNKLVAGGGPSCWQCSRLIVDVGFVTGVWLYQRDFADGPEDHQCSWHWYSAGAFHHATAATCGID